MFTSEATKTLDATDVRSTSWSAVGSMAMCVALLIAAEFMPVSLLTPIAADLHATAGMAGQAISISGLFAVITSLYIATFASRFDRKYVLTGLTAIMTLSLALIALAPNFAVLMVARALLGVVVGGFWSLATATVMRLVPEAQVPKALGILYMGNAMATAFAAPIGSYFGGIIGWRGVFWALAPFSVAALIWQWISLPHIPPASATPVSKLFGLLKRKNVAFAMAGVMLSFAGAFAIFTYLRPFLETRTHVTLSQLSLLLLGLGTAGFIGTSAATALVKRHLYVTLGLLPVFLAAVTAWMLAAQHVLWSVSIAMIAWGPSIRLSRSAGRPGSRKVSATNPRAAVGSWSEPFSSPSWQVGAWRSSSRSHLDHRDHHRRMRSSPPRRCRRWKWPQAPTSSIGTGLLKHRAQPGKDIMSALKQTTRRDFLQATTVSAAAALSGADRLAAQPVKTANTGPYPTSGMAGYTPYGPLKAMNFQRRALGPKDVAIRIHYCGVCHSDIHTIHGDWGDIQYPLVTLPIGGENTRNSI